MLNVMYSRVILSITAIIPLFLLIVYYFSKIKLDEKTYSKIKIRHKIYMILLVSDFILLLADFIIAIVFGLDLPYIARHLALKFRFFMDFIYFSASFYYYYVSTSTDLENKRISIRELIRDNRPIKIHFIISVFLSIVYFILPFKDLNKDTFDMICGPAFYVALVYSVITSLCIVFFSFYKKKTGNIQRVSLFFYFFIMVFVVTVQFLFRNIISYGLSGVIHNLALYFLSENPDLDLAEKINQLSDEIEKASHTKSDFLSNMSHEIRSPMNAIVGFSETILNSDEFDEKKIYNDVGLIESSSKNLLEIINNILDISKIESERDTLDERDFSLKTLLRDLHSIIEERIGDKKIKLLFDLDSTIPNNLRGDATKLYQVLLNILTNSVKYTEVGRINLTLTKDMRNPNVILKFKISDTGYGIKKEDFDKMFEKFSRLDEATTNEIEGTGLGLVITKKYVDLMGGKIWFDSVYGAGTTFYVEVPFQIVDLAMTIGKADDRSDDDTIDGDKLLDCTGHKILVVDDNRLNLKVARRLLERYGFTIDTCLSGKDCIFKYKSGEHYDMIFMDHMMPEMDGIEAMHIIRKLEDYETPVMVVLTANAVAGAKEMYLREGFDEYLSKPINMLELDLLINKYFQK